MLKKEESHVQTMGAVGLAGVTTLLLIALVTPAQAAPTYDLTAGPITLSYTVDLSQAANVDFDWDWNNASYVGMFSGGIGGPGALMFGALADWNQAGFQFPGTDSPASLDNDDKFNMQRFPNPGSYDEAMYDVDCTDPLTPSLHATPTAPGANHGVWFDRDGVDQWQAAMWGMVNGDTYNTDGIYDVVLTFKRIDADTVGVCPTVNNRTTGFYSSWVNGPPNEFYPAGISFDATEAQMKTMGLVVDTDTTVGTIVVSNINIMGSWTFDGFYGPVDNPPTMNAVKAGQAVPVKFSLNGDLGLGVFEAGYPKSSRVDCDTSADLDAVEETVMAGESSLQYDAITDTYTYVWKTDRTWAGTCRQLTVKLADGSSHLATFKFK